MQDVYLYLLFFLTYEFFSLFTVNFMNFALSLVFSLADFLIIFSRKTPQCLKHITNGLLVRREKNVHVYYSRKRTFLYT
ncbi:hypothetical protein CW304_19130 [Bacillus sp. UFRGS-B20]|nr:hypothetical protein CW304_19130 [Bacillus sp. UFRGS-B20]